MGWTRVLVAAYLVVWLIGLVDAIRRPAFYPVLGRGWSTRILWVLSFLFFNPFLTLWYWVFGHWVRPGPRASVLARTAVVLLVLVTALMPFVLYGGTGIFAVEVLAASVCGEMSPAMERLYADESKPAVTARRVESRVASSSSLSTSGGDPSMLACRRIDVVVDTQIPLGDLLGKAVSRRLREVAGIDEVRLRSTSDYPLHNGARLPDAVLLLDVEACEPKPGLATSTMDATIRFRYGESPWIDETHHEVSLRTPPVLSICWKGTIEHHSDAKGLVVARGHYAGLADSVSDSIVKDLEQNIAKWEPDHPLLDSLPDICYGPWKPVHDVPFAQWDSTRVISSGHWILTANRTVWDIEDQAPPTEILERMKAELLDSGWSIDESVQTHEGMAPSLRMTLDNTAIFATAVGEMNDECNFEPWVGNDGAADRGRVRAVYEELLDDDELETVLQTLLDERAPLETVMLFSNLSSFCDPPTKKRWYEQLEAAREHSLRALYMLAWRMHQVGNPERAAALLRRAVVRSYLTGEFHKFKSKAEQLAKTLEQEDVLMSPWRLEELADFGAVRLEGKELPLVLCGEYGRPLVFVRGTDDHPTVTSVLYEELPNGKERFSMQQTIGEQGANAHMSRSTIQAMNYRIPVSLWGEDASLHRFETSSGEMVFVVSDDMGEAQTAFEEACGDNGGSSLCAELAGDVAAPAAASDAAAPATSDRR